MEHMQPMKQMDQREHDRGHSTARLATVAALAAGAAALVARMRPSAEMRLAKFALRRMPAPVPADADAARRKYAGRRYPVAAPVTDGVRRRCEVREDRTLGQPVYTLTPKRGGSGWHILYTHGGAFVDALTTAHWGMIGALIDATGATVTVPIYPLAPEHTHEAAFQLLEQVYRDLLERVAPERLVLCGDSAGGNLALAQALRYRDAGLPLPGHLVLFAPALDLTLANPEARAIEPRDPLIRIDGAREIMRWWAGTTDPGSPALSPLAADLRGLPPIQLYQGTDDVLMPDARILRDRVTAAGGRIAYHETPGGFHVFMMATFTPEAKEVFRQVALELERPAALVAGRRS
jgi:epsilon-lactone hydrolase